jgi:hydroxyacylglutathione hydrolase
MYTELEDEFGDVVAKTRRGLELDQAALEQRAGLGAGQLAPIERYEMVPDEATVSRLADTLGLDRGKLQASVEKHFFPLHPAGRDILGLQVEMLVLGSDFLMNGYIVACTETLKAVVIDPGFDAETLMKTIEGAKLEVELVLLTHGHGDHTGALKEICAATEAPAFINRADLPLIGNLNSLIEGTIVDGEVFNFGKQELVAQPTPGHTAGGMTLIHREAAFVGDALFAGSTGGTRTEAAFRQQMEAIQAHILGLDDHVVVYPGHGPATSVGEEKGNNPFFS